jgi:hypothetical protein
MVFSFPRDHQHFADRGFGQYSSCFRKETEDPLSITTHLPRLLEKIERSAEAWQA